MDCVDVGESCRPGLLTCGGTKLPPRHRTMLQKCRTCDGGREGDGCSSLSRLLLLSVLSVYTRRKLCSIVRSELYGCFGHLTPRTGAGWLVRPSDMSLVLQALFLNSGVGEASRKVGLPKVLGVELVPERRRRFSQTGNREGQDETKIIFSKYKKDYRAYEVRPYSRIPIWSSEEFSKK